MRRGGAADGGRGVGKFPQQEDVGYTHLLEFLYRWKVPRIQWHRVDSPSLKHLMYRYPQSHDVHIPAHLADEPATRFERACGAGDCTLETVLV